MYWENIQGFFNFDNIYSRIVNLAQPGSLFVEIGSWKGKSSVFMAEKIKESGKNIEFYVIDTFDGTENEHEDYDEIKNKNLYDVYLKNIEPLKSYIKTVKGSSLDVHAQFNNNSIDFLFIDGDHTYKGVRSDLENWFTKVKAGGIIAGHDYTEPTCGVRMAVDQFFLFTGIQVDRSSWIYKKI